jgi:hypothetical protein
MFTPPAMPINSSRNTPWPTATSGLCPTTISVRRGTTPESRARVSARPARTRATSSRPLRAAIIGDAGDRLLMLAMVSGSTTRIFNHPLSDSTGARLPGLGTVITRWSALRQDHSSTLG